MNMLELKFTSILPKIPEYTNETLELNDKDLGYELEKN